MKAKLNHLKFKKSLSYINKAVQTKPNIAILSNVLIEAINGVVKLSSTNLDMGVSVWIPSMVEIEGSVTVSAKSLADFVSAITGDNVNIEKKGSQLEVSTSSAKALFNTIDAAEFPVLPKIAEEILFEVEIVEFEKTLDKVSFAASNDFNPAKIQLTGIYIEKSNEYDNHLTFVGLDSYRLSMRDVEVKSLSFESDQSALIPARYLSDISKILSDLDDVKFVKVYLSELQGQLIFKTDEVEISVRLIDAKYPAFRQSIPASYEYKFVASKSELERSLKVMSAFSRENTTFKVLVDMDLGAKMLTFSSIANEVGQNESRISIQDLESPSEPLKTAYSLKFLADAVQHISGQEVIVETKGSTFAAILRDPSDQKFTHVIMPIRRES